jgi:hypothetical protein
MIRKLIAATVVLFFPALAFGIGTAGYAEVAYERPAQDFAYDIDTYEGEGHRVVDLTVNVDDGDKWTTAYAAAYFECAFDPMVCCGTFWEHPEGGDTQAGVNTNFFGLTAFDSFWTCSEEYPNADADPEKNATTFAPGSPIAKEDCLREAEWYVDPEDPEVDGGLWVLARYNFTVDCSLCPCPPGMECVDYPTDFDVCCWLMIEGDMYYASTGGEAWPYSLAIPVCWCIPEPGSLGLLALGALALIRRR